MCRRDIYTDVQILYCCGVPSSFISLDDDDDDDDDDGVTRTLPLYVQTVIFFCGSSERVLIVKSFDFLLYQWHFLSSCTAAKTGNTSRKGSLYIYTAIGGIILQFKVYV
jgi:hypothetical protein